jgi:TPR repeat protein
MRWRISNIPPDIRKRARDAAKAADLPLGPWLERASRHELTTANSSTPSATPPEPAIDSRVEVAPAPQEAGELAAATEATPPTPAAADKPSDNNRMRRVGIIGASAALVVGTAVAAWLWPPTVPSPSMPPPASEQRAEPDAAPQITADTTPDESSPPAADSYAVAPPELAAQADDAPAAEPSAPAQNPRQTEQPAAPQPRPGTIAELQRDALNGDAMAQHDLGIAYVNGRGVPQNYQIAAGWFEKASAAGLERAQYNLAVLYENALGVPQDFKRAFELYRAAAELGFAPAQHNVGVAYAQGRGVSRDYRAAALWFRRAADQNIPPAQYNLGMIHEMGLAGPADPKTAYGWYRRAAAGGSQAAVARLAAMEGRIAPDAGSSGQAGKPPRPTRAQVAEIQQLLGRLSFDAGPHDGKIGPATRAAIRQYEKIAGMKVSGEASVALLEHLRQVTGMMEPGR